MVGEYAEHFRDEGILIQKRCPSLVGKMTGEAGEGVRVRKAKSERVDGEVRRRFVHEKLAMSRFVSGSK